MSLMRSFTLLWCADKCAQTQQIDVSSKLGIRKSWTAIQFFSRTKLGINKINKQTQ
jgi:hypothetical protein